MTKQEYIDIAVEYFPDALAEIGKLCVVANEKHNPGEHIHWDRSKSFDHWGSWGRHLSKLGTIDPDTGMPHASSWAWRTLAINQTGIEKDIYRQIK